MAKYYTCRATVSDKLCLLPTVDGLHCEQHKGPSQPKRGRGRPKKLITKDQLPNMLPEVRPADPEHIDKPIWPV